VYVHKDDDDKINEFSQKKWAPFEWANLAWLPPKYCEGGNSAVFEHLARELPLSYKEIISFEIDRPEDMAIARKFAGK
jgi:cell wall assembly regulator SMI1